MSSEVSKYLKKVLPVAVAVCMLILVVAALLARPEYKNYAIMCRWEPAGETDNTGENFARDLTVLQKRLDALKDRFELRNATVTASDSENLAIEFRCARKNLDEILFWLTLPGQIEFLLLHPDPLAADIYGEDELPEGYEIKRYSQYVYSLSRPGELKSEEHIYLVSASPILQLREFDSVDFDTRGFHKTTVLIFRFKPGHARLFKEATALNVGRQMVMAIDGRLFFPPREIQQAIEGGVVEVQGYFYNPPLRKLVDVLDAGGLKGNLEVTSRDMK